MSIDKTISITKNPKLSVVIASYNAAKTIEVCLKSLENQKTAWDYEIIVVDSSTDGTAKLVEDRFPEVRLYRFAERKFCGDARNFGISVAKGETIAFIDADCQAQDDWIEKIIMAHESLDSPAVGGAIANGNPESYVGWAAYFCEFSQWIPGLNPKWMDDIAGANMSYKRKVFDHYGCFIEGTYCSDTEFHWRLGKGNYRLRFDPLIRVFHYNIDSLRQFLNHESFHGQCFAKVRMRAKSFSGLKRFIYVIFSPLLPVKLFYTIVCINMRNKIYLKRFLLSSPLLILGLICWSLGECFGYVKG